MSRPVYQVEGGRQLRKQLRAAGDDLQSLRDAHRQAAEIVAPVATALAPAVSSRLRGTIRAAGTKTAAIIRAGFARVPYAGPIHWGWPARNIPANPFLSVAAQKTESHWFLVYEQHVDKALAQVKGKTP